MADNEQGLVLEVSLRHTGDEAAVDSALGASTITVYDTANFSETGGQLMVNNLIYTYLSADPDTGIITLSGTLTAAVLATDRVYAYPLAEEKWAMVKLTYEPEAISVRIPHSLTDKIAEGIRDETKQESVILEMVDGQWTVKDVFYKAPTINIGYVSSDGSAPAGATVGVATGGPGFIALRWAAVLNADPVTYKVYGSTSTGFVVDGTTLLQATAGTSWTHVPNPVDYTVTWYYRVVASDADGDGPASAEFSAMMRQINSPDISVAYLYAGDILVNQLKGGTLNADISLASRISTRLDGTGPGIDIDTSGEVIYDSLGQPATVLTPDSNSFKGNVEANGLTVTGAGSFRSSLEIARTATQTLQSATTAAQSSPSVVVGWPDPIVEPLFAGDIGLVWTGSNWAMTGDTTPNPSVYRRGIGSMDLVGAGVPRPFGGITQMPPNTDWFTLGWKQSTGTWFITKYNSAGVMQVQVGYTPIAGTWGSGGSAGPGLAPAAIGWDSLSATILVGEWDQANNRYRIQSFNASTLALISTLNTSVNVGFTGPVVGIRAGNFDFGAKRYVILTKNGSYFYPFDSAGTYQPNDAWDAPVPGSMSGFDWDGTRFWSTRARNVSGNPWLYKHTLTKWTGTTPQTWYAASTWRDTDAGGTGTHETSMSPVATFPMKKRAGVTLTSPTIPDSGDPDDANAVGFYVGNVNAVRTNLWQQTLPADGVNSLILKDTVVFSGTNPPLSGNFPSSTPGRIISSATDGSNNPLFVVSGNGDMFRGPNAAQMLTQILSAVCTTNVDLLTAEVDVTGATVTFNTVRPNAKYMCFGSFYFSAIAASSGVASGKLSVDGVVQSAKANFTGTNTVPDRTNSSQNWSGTLASIGSHTLKLRAIGSASPAAQRVNATDTTIIVWVFE